MYKIDVETRSAVEVILGVLWVYKAGEPLFIFQSTMTKNRRRLS